MNAPTSLLESHSQAQGETLRLLTASGMAADQIRAAAAEASGRKPAASLRKLADALERGQTLGGEADALHFLAAVATGDTSVVAALADYLQVQEQLRSVSRRLVRSWGIIAVVILVACGLSLTVRGLMMGITTELVEEFELVLPEGEIEGILFLHSFGMGVAILVAAGGALLLVARRWGGPLRALSETLLDFVPLTGRVLASVDIALMVDRMSRLLAARRTYRQALTELEPLTESRRLQRWMAETSRALEQGGSIDAAMMRLPIHAGPLPVLVKLAGHDAPATVAAWRQASRTLVDTTMRRESVSQSLLLPIAMTLAALVAWSGLVAAFYMIQTLLGLISSLGF